MSQMNLITCLYIKTIAGKFFSPASGLQKNSDKCFSYFTGRVNKLGYITVTSIFQNYVSIKTLLASRSNGFVKKGCNKLLNLKII